MRAGEVYSARLGRPGNGHEQAGQDKRVLLISEPLNMGTLAIVVPLTSVWRGWETHEVIRYGDGETSTALCEQVRALDTSSLGRARGTVDTDGLTEVRQIVAGLIGVYR